MRALPRSDPRSLYAQAQLHCAYCGGAFKYKGSAWGLEIHGGWFFFAWHRAFLYFHERILASLIRDHTFALPFWNWDNQLPIEPLGNIIPCYFDEVDNNPLYSPNRAQCARPPNIVDLAYTGAGLNGECPDMEGLQDSNGEIMRLQMSAETARLFHGNPYRYNTRGGRSPGNMERTPHGNVHVFAGDPLADLRLNPDTQQKYAAYDDMGNLNRAAYDPLFYAHHTNLDRLWDFWIKQGGAHTDFSDPDYLNSKFIFYDEKQNLVSIQVSQVLDLDKLRYKYDDMINPWLMEPPLDPPDEIAPSPSMYVPPPAPPAPPPEMGMMRTIAEAFATEPSPGPTADPTTCSPTFGPDVSRIIRYAPPLRKNGTQFSTTPLTFRVRRLDTTGKGFEVLTFSDLVMDWTEPAQIHAFLFLPNATAASISCPEFFGTFSHIPEAARTRPKDFSMTWTLGLTTRLREIGKLHVRHVVVTLVQIGSEQLIRFQDAIIEIDSS